MGLQSKLVGRLHEAPLRQDDNCNISGGAILSFTFPGFEAGINGGSCSDGHPLTKLVSLSLLEGILIQLKL